MEKEKIVDKLNDLLHGYRLRLSEAREEADKLQADYREAIGRVEEIESMIIDLDKTIKQL